MSPDVTARDAQIAGLCRESRTRDEREAIVAAYRMELGAPFTLSFGVREAMTRLRNDSWGAVLVAELERARRTLVAKPATREITDEEVKRAVYKVRGGEAYGVAVYEMRNMRAALESVFAYGVSVQDESAKVAALRANYAHVVKHAGDLESRLAYVNDCHASAVKVCDELRTRVTELESRIAAISGAFEESHEAWEKAREEVEGLEAQLAQRQGGDWAEADFDKPALAVDKYREQLDGAPESVQLLMRRTLFAQRVCELAERLKPAATVSRDKLLARIDEQLIAIRNHLGCAP